MRALVVYESIFGNTRDVAQAVAAGIQSRADQPVVIAEVGEAPQPSDQFDLVVVGGPIHAWGMTSAMTRAGAVDEAERAHVEPVSRGIGVREWLQELAPGACNASAAAFDTAMNTRWFPVGSAARGEARALERAGYHLVAAPEHFLVADKRGPLIPGELDRARAWGAAIAGAARDGVAS